MNTLLRRINLPILLAVVAFAFLAGLVAKASIAPAVVAVVDLEKVFNSLNQHTDRDNALREIDDKSAKDFKRQQVDIEKLEKELENYDVSSESYINLTRKINQALTRLAAGTQLAEQRATSKRAKLMQETYDSIKKSAATYAQSNGIDIVFLDDTIPKLKDGTPGSVVEQISARRMIYADRRLDITADFLTFMNAEYAKSK
jgi:Skp family chaperone for outer membrane proteins